MTLTLNELCRRAYDNAKLKGFWEHDAGEQEYSQIATRLALVHSEVSEGLEELRLPDFSRDAFLEEMADVFIRVGDVCAHFGADMEAIVLEKMSKNEKRPQRHGKRF